VRAYLSVFRLRFVHGLQYRTAALAGIPTDELEVFLDTLATVRAGIAAAPYDLGPPAPRRPPPELRRK